MKKIISIMLSAIMVFSVIGICDLKVPVNAEEADWAATAITSPTAGELVGAGYIDITYKTDLKNATEYHVYFDGVLAEQLDKYKYTTIDENNAKCEVYTTKVSAHTAKVVATTSEGEVESATITFYVSKKGIAIGGDMSKTVKLKQMNLSWYYNWDSQPFSSIVDEKVSHAPMIWGKGNQKDENGNALTDEDGQLLKTPMEEYKESVISQVTKVDSNSKYMLGFNEPDLEAQANMSVQEALELWPLMQKDGRRMVSPVSKNPNGPSAWLTEFMDAVDSDESLNCDSVALHYYNSYPSKKLAEDTLRVVDATYEKYGKPIWVTEISIMGHNKKYTDYSYENLEARKKIEEYLTLVVEGLEAREYVERYAWFPYNINSDNDIDGVKYSGATAMFDYETGGLTDLGVLYANLGNPEGYKLADITDRYVEPTTEPVTEPTTKPKNEATTKQPTPTTKPKVVKPGTPSIRTAKNVKKKSLKLTWKKASNAKKYQIQYSMNKKFKKGNKTKVTNKLKYTIKGLKKKKTYYVRVRGINGKTYGKWSKAKKVKIKK